MTCEGALGYRVRREIAMEERKCATPSASFVYKMMMNDSWKSCAHVRVWTPCGTGLRISTETDWAVMASD